MNIIEETISVKTHSRNEMIDITSQIQTVVSKSGINSGMAVVSCPHTTAAITINENADPEVPHDILMTLEALVPQLRKGYRHNEGGVWLARRHLRSFAGQSGANCCCYVGGNRHRKTRHV